MTVFFLSLGGFLGAVLRYWMGLPFLRQKGNFPFGTLFINIVGAFLLGVFVSLPINTSIYRLLGDGFCGAFTTFSTFMTESAFLGKEAQKVKAVLYVVISVVVGLIFFSCGYMLGKGF